MSSINQGFNIESGLFSDADGNYIISLIKKYSGTGGTTTHRTHRTHRGI